MSEIIEQAIATAETQGAQEAVETKSEVNEEIKTEGEAQESKPEKSFDHPWPKTARNAVTKRDRKIGKLEAEIAQLRSQVPQKTELKTDSGSDAPDESKFENYGDYLKAVAKWEARQEFATQRKQEQQQQLASKEQEWASERMAVVS